MWKDNASSKKSGLPFTEEKMDKNHPNTKQMLTIQYTSLNTPESVHWYLHPSLGELSALLLDVLRRLSGIFSPNASISCCNDIMPAAMSLDQ